MFFINENYINSLIDDNSLKNDSLQRDILRKAEESRGLSLKESAALLNISAPELYDELFDTAKKVKESIYGNRVEIFAPLYLSNVCVNNCLYCAFRKDNRKLKGKSLTLDEIAEETLHLLRTGQKNILMIVGQHPDKAVVPFIGETINRIYELNINGNKIGRLNVNSVPLSFEEYKLLKSYGIGTYHCFQESYHYSTYLTMHPEVPKKDYPWRLYAVDRALQAGIDDIGIGALFGLTDFKFETLALLNHAFDLELKYGIGPHSISVPRLETALNTPGSIFIQHAVDDLSFKKLVAVIRLAVPYTGIILSTRERTEFRRELLSVGISQISVDGNTAPEIYKESQQTLKEYQLEQFRLNDHRSLDEVVKELTLLGYTPSFCSACYRTKRTGDAFMELAKSSHLRKFCIPNSITALKEYLNDFATEETKKIAYGFLKSGIEKLDIRTREKVEAMTTKVDAGERDIYF